MTKKIIIIQLFILCAVVSFAQQSVIQNLTTFDNQKLRFGFKLGLNTSDLVMDNYASLYDNGAYDPSATLFDSLEYYLVDAEYVVKADVTKLTPGFTVGMIVNYRLGKYFDLRFIPGLSLASRKVNYNIPVYQSDNGSVQKLEYYTMRSTLLDFPLLVKYKSSRYNNSRHYFIGGVSYRLDISKDSDNVIQTKKSRYYVEAGLGLDTYFSFFKLGTEIRFSYGLNNILKTDDLHTNNQDLAYQQALKSVRPLFMTLIFCFE